MHDRRGDSKLFLRQAAAEEVTGSRLGGQLVRILMLASFLPIARIMSAAG
jgi:hypothetical protein